MIERAKRAVSVIVVVAALSVSPASTGITPARSEETTTLVTDCDAVPDPIEAEDLLELVLPPDCYWVGHMILDHGVGARVPPPGTGVHTQRHGRERAAELLIETLSDGSLQLAYVGDVVGEELLEVPPIPPIPGVSLDPDLLVRTALREPCSSCLPPCKDDAHYLMGYKEFASYRWRLNRTSIPKRFNRKRVTKALKRGFNSTVNVFNDCDMSAGTDLRGGFDGRTRRRANLDREGRCVKSDGRNVVDFGPLPTAGLTCSWFLSKSGYNEHIESDVRLSKTQKWTTKPGSSCSGRLDVRSLATHEFGHVFGLGHVGSDSKNLTMAERLPVCSIAPRTLGLGDIRALRTLYGTS